MGVASDHGQFVYTGGVASSEATEQVIEMHILWFSKLIPFKIAVNFDIFVA